MVASDLLQDSRRRSGFLDEPNDRAKQARPPAAACAALCSARAGASSGSGCGRRWRRSRPRSVCSWRCLVGRACGCRCRRWRAPSASSCLRVLLHRRRVPALRLRVPTRHDGLRRLDRGSGEPHRPATAIADEIAANGDDPVAQALWRAHVERALLSARKLKAGWPSPRLALRDPIALRALVLILVVATFFAAGGERMEAHRRRLRLARRGRAGEFPRRRLGQPAALYRPPAGHAARPAPGRTAQRRPRPISVPAGSKLVVRATGKSASMSRQRRARGRAGRRERPLPAGTEEHRFIIKGDGSATVHGVGSDLDLELHRHSRPPPTIELIKDPERQARGALRLDYRVEDDYGVIEAQGDIRAQGRTPAADRRTAHPLLRRAGFRADAAAGAHAHRRGADHARSHRASLGRRRSRR